MKKARYLIGIPVLIFLWHVLVCLPSADHPDVKINPLTDVATVKVPGPSATNQSDVGAFKIGEALAGTFIAPIAENKLNLEARKWFDIYAMTIPFKVEFAYEGGEPQKAVQRAQEPTPEPAQTGNPMVISLLKAAEKGDANAQSSLGLMYDNGEGVPRDDAQAAFWWRQAAEEGLVDAQGRLGALYYQGLGVTQDYSEAYFWLSLAASGKIEGIKRQEVIEWRDGAASHLTPTELSQGQERVRKWPEEHPQK